MHTYILDLTKYDDKTVISVEKNGVDIFNSDKGCSTPSSIDKMVKQAGIKYLFDHSPLSIS